MSQIVDAALPFEDLHDERLVIGSLHTAGLTQVAVPASGRADVAALCAAREALAYRSPLADAVLAVLGLGCDPLLAAGGALAARYVTPVAEGRTACGFALTEPDAGSDVGAIATSARRDGDAYVVNGRKTFISNAPIAGWFVVFVRAEGGPAALVIERDAPGVRVETDVPLSVAHPIGSLVFEDARIPAANLVGAEGEGIRLALATLDRFRPSVGAAACGMAARALDEALRHVTTRRQFGKLLSEQQLTQARLAECAVELEASRQLVRRAVESVGSPAAKLHAAMAKLYATEAAQRIIDAAVQLHGGQGVVRGTRVEALYREVRSLRIYEGTSEIQKLIIARELLRGPR